MTFAPEELYPLEELLKRTQIQHPEQLAHSSSLEDVASLELQNDIQGGILKSHGRQFSIHLFLEFDSEKVDDIRSGISLFAQKFITSAVTQRELRQRYYKRKISSQQDDPHDPPFVNFFISFEGYKTLLKCESKKLEKHFSDFFFRLGMRNSAGDNDVLLKDPPLSSWEKGFSEHTIHALILLAHNNLESLRTYSQQVIDDIGGFAKIVHTEVGKVFRNENGKAIEHFGFVDGISQPLFFKDDVDRCSNKWDPSAPLELVLTKDPFSPNRYGCGSYLVYRKLQQDIDRFNTKIAELARSLEIKQELAEAFVMGRFKDGTPVTLYNRAQCLRDNNFNYQDDHHGTRCPFHAHIRKTNPRGDKTTNGSDIDDQRARRIARRGISYSYEKGKNRTWEEQLRHLDQISIETDNHDVGLLFMCFQGNIQEQFATLQRKWGNPNHFPKKDTGIDPVIGQGKQLDSGQYWPKGKDGWDENHKGRYDFSKCVQMKGGEYFFAPSISFLKDLPSFNL